ncbi:PREDICTED: mitogen-activated protein kinase-binding protein 1 [Lupinus angustifolius]|uniref:mitogen-activated protein kinase-binding protein 1 n=1 Tax=Lupinus angustifolius TaxID=3871 RepID=UPI00092F7A47|nr:PREDICTED: mitogen-activated protein kinase-binding protein 1 [Lupinus angustifolius]
MKPNSRFNKPNTTAPNLVLEEVIGLTTKNSNGVASNASSSKCVYLVGSVVVVYDVSLGTQSHLMVSHRLPKPLNCVALSRDGRFVAAGEAGISSSVLVWDSSTFSIVSELKGHLYGAACICFSPNGKHLVSVGGYIYLWDWRSGELVTKLQVTSSCSAISSVSFSSDAKFIVTAGKKHLKFWGLGSSGRTQLNGEMRRSATLAIHEKHANLAIHKGSSFISVVSSVWSNSSYDNCKQAGDCFPIHALTDSGNLYLIHSGLSVKKSVALKVQKAFALSASGKLIACACNNGVVLLLTPMSLECVGTILYSKAKKFYEGNNTVFQAKVPKGDFQEPLALPDAVACQFSALERLVVIYGDHSLYIWDIHDLNQATRCFVLVSHSSCIWDIKNLCCENMHDQSLACTARGCSGGMSFATCSADGTIRLWDLALQSDLSKDAEEHQTLKAELLGSSCLVSAGTFERDVVKADLISQEFRSLAVSSDGMYLAAGDCKGNLHIFNLQTSDYTCFQGAHDAEILTLSFNLATQDVSEEIAKQCYFLASGGRDCVIHLYDVRRNFDLVDRIDDHSAAVTSIKISSNSCRILSCSADSFLVLRDVEVADNGYKILQQHRQKASQCGAVYDMAVDPSCETVVTVGQDKKIKAFDMSAQKLIRSYNHDKFFGEPIKVIMDPSCSYVVCSFSNKSICIYDFLTGEMVAKAMGHAEIVTGVIFLPDCKHIVSVDGDGCIFVWKLPAPLSSKILGRLMERSNPLSPRSLAQPPACSHLSFCEGECQHPKINPENVWPLGNSSQSEDGSLYPESNHTEASSFKFSASRLPKWAQAKVISSSVCKNLNASSETYALSSPEVQVPSNHASSSPKTENSRCSSRLGGTLRNTAVDNRWHSVYTVCMDALSSPELQNLMDTKFPEVPSSLRQDNPVITKGHNPFGLISHCKNETMNLVSEKHVGCNSNDISCSPEEISDKEAEQLHLHEPGTESETTLHTNLESLQNEEDSDMFKQHFGSLSNTHKIKSKNTPVRRFSAAYVVQRDYTGDLNKLFSSPIRNRNDKSKNSKDGNETHVISENRSLHLMENVEMKNSLEQDLKNSTQPSEETIAACKEAFRSLGAAADSAVQSFLKLENGSGEEVSSGAGAQFLSEAAELLPLIAEKVNAVARLVQHRKKNNQGGSRLGLPLVGENKQRKRKERES